MGTSEAHTDGEYVTPSRGPDSPTVNTGSDALITWVKLTDILQKLMHAATCPTLWKNATGNSDLRNPGGRFGTGWIRNPHITHMMALLAISWKEERKRGIGKAFSVSLFRMVKPMLNKYHAAIYAPRRTDDARP